MHSACLDRSVSQSPFFSLYFALIRLPRQLGWEFILGVFAAGSRKDRLVSPSLPRNDLPLAPFHLLDHPLSLGSRPSRVGRVSAGRTILPRCRSRFFQFTPSSFASSFSNTSTNEDAEPARSCLATERSYGQPLLRFLVIVLKNFWFPLFLSFRTLDQNPSPMTPQPSEFPRTLFLLDGL